MDSEVSQYDHIVIMSEKENLSLKNGLKGISL